jgi:dihydroneopterin aldolase
VIPIVERFPRPSVMGVVNVTPDSFSDGGVHLDPDAAAAAARRMVDERAAIVDVGGESTRPGSEGVSAEDELRRVVPVLDRLGGEIPLSIDTSKAAVARAALERGAIFVNDVTALRGDPELAGVVADAGAYLCLMHMRREPRTMQKEPRYDDVASEVASFLEERMAFAVAEGIPEERITQELAPEADGIRRPARSERGGGRCGIRARRDDLARPRRAADGRRAHRRPRNRVITVEVRDLRVFGRHGVHEEERERGQDFVFDVELVVGERGTSDRLEDAVDYVEVARIVHDVSEAEQYNLLEALASAVADELERRFAPERMRVRVRKPEVRPAGLDGTVAATVTRP